MSELGIYFGIKGINITEVKGKSLINNISIPIARISGPETEQRVPDEVKIVSALKDEFSKINVIPKEISLTLAGEDLIIRTFDLPIFLSKKELGAQAIGFEARKYIPFKLEEILFDFRLYPNKEDKKTLVLFAGIKKQTLEDYISIFKQMQINIGLIDYAGLGLFRLLSLVGLKDKGILGLLSVDLEEETNFLVCQNGFPLFSRDITLIPKAEMENKAESITSKETKEISPTSKLVLMERLKSEIRISLDYCHRKFPTKTIEKIIILSPIQSQTDILNLIKDLGLTAIPLDISKFLNKDIPFYCALAKSYAAAINKTKKMRFQPNLLTPWIRKQKVSELAPAKALPISLPSFKVNPKVIFLAAMVISLAFGWGRYKQSSLEKELRSIRSSQLQVEGVSIEQSFEVISGVESEYINKIEIMDNLIKNRFYLTDVLNTIPLVMPKSTWLNSFSFRAGQNKWELTLEGMVFLNNPEEEFGIVGDIVQGLKDNPKINQRFREINVTSMERISLSDLKLEVTKFTILCQ